MKIWMVAHSKVVRNALSDFLTRLGYTVGTSDSLIGKNDFSSFRASSCQSNNPIREIRSISVIQEDQIRIKFIANAYLHHMIRNIMGTLIDIGHGKIEPDGMKEILDAKDRKLASKKVSADGLYLFSVKYPEKYQLPTIGI